MIDQHQRVPIGNARIALAQALVPTALDHPRRRQLAAPIGLRPGRKLGVFALKRLDQSGIHQRVLEEAPGVADHRRIRQLPGTQAHDRLSHMERRRLVDTHPRQLFVDTCVIGAQRTIARQDKPYRRDDIAARLMLEQRIAIAKHARRVVERYQTLPAHIPGFDCCDKLRHFAAVRTDVLDRGGAHGAGNHDQVLQPGIPLAE